MCVSVRACVRVRVRACTFECIGACMCGLGGVLKENKRERKERELKKAQTRELSVRIRR